MNSDLLGFLEADIVPADSQWIPVCMIWVDAREDKYWNLRTTF